MKAQEFIDLVNSSNFEEFSDIPEHLVKFVDSRVSVKYSLDETYITSMNIYECDICGAISKPKIIFTHMNEILEELPDNWERSHCTADFDKKKVIYIKAKRVKIELKPVFVEIDDSDTDSCWLDMKCHQTNDTKE